MSWLNPNSDLKKQFNEFYADVEIVLGGIHQDLEKIKTEYDQRISYLSQLGEYLNDSEKLNQIKLVLEQSEQNKALINSTLNKLEKEQKENNTLINNNLNNIRLKINELKINLEQAEHSRKKIEHQFKNLEHEINYNHKTLSSNLEAIKKEIYLKIDDNLILCKKELDESNLQTQKTIENFEKKITQLKYIAYSTLIVLVLLILSIYI